MIIIPKLQILHNLKNMICHILVEMILLQKRNTQKILMMMVNTKGILRDFKTVMNVLIILKLRILYVNTIQSVIDIVNLCGGGMI